MIEPLSTSILLSAIGLLVIVAGIASPLSGRFGIPTLVLFLVLGVAAGSEGIGGIAFDDHQLAFRLGIVALVLILFDGGLNTSPDAFRQSLRSASLLATVAVMVTALVVTGAAMVMNVPWRIALLTGAVVSSTDAAAVFSILRNSAVHLKRSTAATLEVESGLNDPMAIFLTMATTELVLGGSVTGGQWLLVGLAQLVVGTAAGVAFGYAGRFLLRAIRLPAGGLYPALTLALAFLAFGIPTLMGGSGFLSVYLAAIVLTAGPLPYRAGIRRVHDALAWLAQILMFVMLGLLVFPSRLLPNIGVGLVLAFVLAFIARPLAVWPVVSLFKMPVPERLFVSWVGLRGAVPIVLASYPVLRGVPEADQIFHLVFFVVLLNSLVPGATVPWVAKRLGLARTVNPQPEASVELVSLQEFPGHFSWYFVSPASAVAGAHLRDLPLPESCVVTMVVRATKVIPARGDTQLLSGDQVCIFYEPGTDPLLSLLFGAEPGDSL